MAPSAQLSARRSIASAARQRVPMNGNFAAAPSHSRPAPSVLSAVSLTTVCQGLIATHRQELLNGRCRGHRPYQLTFLPNDQQQRSSPSTLLRPAPAMAARHGQPPANSSALMAPCASARSGCAASTSLRRDRALLHSLAPKAACMTGVVRPADQLSHLAHDKPPRDNPPWCRRALALSVDAAIITSASATRLQRRLRS